MGRMKELSTTHDGETWDETQWTFDPATGLVTNKVYADDSAVAYSYADDGQPERTIWARGDWKENVYTPTGLLAGTTYSDSTPSTTFTYGNPSIRMTRSHAAPSAWILRAPRRSRTPSATTPVRKSRRHPSCPTLMPTPTTTNPAA